MAKLSSSTALDARGAQVEEEESCRLCVCCCWEVSLDVKRLPFLGLLTLPREVSLVISTVSEVSDSGLEVLGVEEELVESDGGESTFTKLSLSLEELGLVEFSSWESFFEGVTIGVRLSFLFFLFFLLLRFLRDIHNVMQRPTSRTTTVNLT